MPNDSKLYLCFEYCDFDLKKYMKSQTYKLSANCIKVSSAPCLRRPPSPRALTAAAARARLAVVHVPDAQRPHVVPLAPHLSPVRVPLRPASREDTLSTPSLPPGISARPSAARARRHAAPLARAPLADALPPDGPARAVT